jgi:hypothetical protein
MRAVWLCVRAGLRQGWRSPLVLALITGLMGALVLVSLAGARRTDTAVPRFLARSGPTEGQVAGVPFRTLGRIARLPGLAYSERGAFMLMAAAPAGHPGAARPGQVTTWALIDNPPQAHAIIVAGRRPSPSRADEVMINETAARILGAHVGSVIQLRGFRPDQVMQVLNNEVLHPTVPLPDVRVTAIIRSPADLGASGGPSDVTYMGTGSLFLTAAFYHRFGGSVGNMAGLSFHLDRGLAGLPAFRAEVKRLTGGRAQFELLVFGASLAHVIGDPRLAGWNWDVAVGNPHSGDTAAQTIPKLRADASLAGFTATALGDGAIGGQDVPVVGIQPLRGLVAPPLLDGRLPRGPREIALSGGELRALHRRVGGLVRARTSPGSGHAPHHRPDRAVTGDHQ